MIYIACALYSEAQPFIQALHLKKNPSFCHPVLFEAQDCKLCITEPGPVKAAIALTKLLSLKPPGKTDLFVNVGICAVSDNRVPIGQLFLCNKIKDQATGRCYYPDLLYRHGFMERELATHYQPVSSPTLERDGALMDMEAAGLFQAAVSYFTVDRLFFFKVASDYGNPEDVSPGFVTGQIAAHVDPILDFIKRIHPENQIGREAFDAEETALIEQAADRLCLSTAMSHQLRQLCRYYKLQNGNLGGLLQLFLTETAACENRNEGKKLFEKLKNYMV